MEGIESQRNRKQTVGRLTNWSSATGGFPIDFVGESGCVKIKWVVTLNRGSFKSNGDGEQNTLLTVSLVWLILQTSDMLKCSQITSLQLEFGFLFFSFVLRGWESYTTHNGRQSWCRRMFIYLLHRRKLSKTARVGIQQHRPQVINIRAPTINRPIWTGSTCCSFWQRTIKNKKTNLLPPAGASSTWTLFLLKRK